MFPPECFQLCYLPLFLCFYLAFFHLSSVTWGTINFFSQFYKTLIFKTHPIIISFQNYFQSTLCFINLLMLKSSHPYSKIKSMKQPNNWNRSVWIFVKSYPHFETPMTWQSKRRTCLALCKIFVFAKYEQNPFPIRFKMELDLHLICTNKYAKFQINLPKASWDNERKWKSKMAA